MNQREEFRRNDLPRRALEERTWYHPRYRGAPINAARACHLPTPYADRRAADVAACSANGCPNCRAAVVQLAQAVTAETALKKKFDNG